MSAMYGSSLPPNHRLAITNAMDNREYPMMFVQLQGEQLSAVTLVQDYLQLRFDGPDINVSNPMSVRVGLVCVTPLEPGFRDTLCAQIAKVVDSVEVREGDAFVITFDDSSELSVSLREEDYRAAARRCMHMVSRTTQLRSPNNGDAADTKTCPQIASANLPPGSGAADHRS